MIFNIIDKDRKDNCISCIQKLKEGDKWEVVIQERKNKRSLAQNRLLHLWIPYLAKHCGYTEKEMKSELKYFYIGSEKYKTRKGVERTHPISTTTLTVKEFAEMLTSIEVDAHEMGVVLPMPDDYRFAMMIE